MGARLENWFRLRLTLIFNLGHFIIGFIQGLYIRKKYSRQE